jgi:hypothetical protein
MANIKISELSELTTIHNSNTIFLVTDLTTGNTKFLRLGTFTPGVQYDYTRAQLAFDRANTAFSVGYSANQAFVKANTVGVTAGFAFDKANTGFNKANTVGVTTDSAFNKANTVGATTDASFNKANTVGVTAASAFDKANTGFNKANTVGDLASAGFDKANTVGTSTTAAFNKANTADTTASAAFNRANTSLVASGDTITGVITAPTAANNTSNTMLATTQFVNNQISERKLISGTAKDWNWNSLTTNTFIDFTGIPSWVKRITVMFSGISTNGTSVPIIQLGDSGGIEITGYLGTGMYGTNGVVASNFTTGFATGNISDVGSTRHGIATISLINTNTWCFSSQLGNSDVALIGWGAGSKSLSDTLDRIRITTVNGTDKFDAGLFNILYE